MSWEFNFTDSEAVASDSPTSRAPHGRTNAPAAEDGSSASAEPVPDLHPNGVWALQALADVRELPSILALRPYLPQSEPPTATSPVTVQLRQAGLLSPMTGLPRDDVAACLFAGGLPDVEIDLLYQRGEDVMTAAIVRRDDVTAAFTRFQDAVTLTQLPVEPELEPVVDELMRFLGDPAPSSLKDVVLPKADFDDMAQCLIQSASPASDLCEVYGLSPEQASQLVDTVDQPAWTVDMGVQMHKRFAKTMITPGGVHLAMTRTGLVTTFAFTARDTEFMSITKGTRSNVQRALAEAVNSLGAGSWGAHRR